MNSFHGLVIHIPTVECNGYMHFSLKHVKTSIGWLPCALGGLG